MSAGIVGQQRIKIEIKLPNSQFTGRRRAEPVTGALAVQIRPITIAQLDIVKTLCLTLGLNMVR